MQKLLTRSRSLIPWKAAKQKQNAEELYVRNSMIFLHKRAMYIVIIHNLYKRLESSIKGTDMKIYVRMQIYVCTNIRV